MPPATAGSAWAPIPGRTAPTALYAFPYKIDVKSLVWYVPENFEDAGYEVPETMEDLKALTEQIVADGGTPWCIGLGSGGATGWPATDWVEDMMLRTQSPETYDKWVTHEMPFNSPEVDGRDRGIRLVRQERRLCRRRRGRRRLDRLPRQPEGSLLVAAAVLHAPPGLVHPVVLPRRHGSRAATPTSSTSRPMRARTWASRFWVPARSSSSPRTARPRARSSNG